LASTVLLAAAGVAVAAYPVRHLWWGGLLLAIAEAGIVGGLADWFAVTALFRRPLGLPIPHTAIIVSNWELLAARVGTMVGERVLTRQYLLAEVVAFDLAGALARAAERITRADLEAATRAVIGSAARELSPASAAEATQRLQRLLLGRPVAPALAAVLEVVHRHGWDGRAVGVAAGIAADALERPEFARRVAGLLDDVLARYRRRLALYPRLVLGVADVFGLIDRDRLVAVLHAGLRDIAADPVHALRRQVADDVAVLARRLRRDAVLAARVERLAAGLIGSAAVGRLAEDAAAALRGMVLADVARPESEAVRWIVARLERWRRTVAADADLRAGLDRWAKRQAVDVIERHHARIAAFIERGVRALGPAGAVRLLEEHAGDDLQYIRVNGTVVGGLAGGLLYALQSLITTLTR
jgi:uncharacterized membrane-anchored protein YjiN (DUF445 family)